MEQDQGNPSDLIAGLQDQMSPIGRHCLDETERATLTACEVTIEDNIGAWVSVTNAMLAIAEGRLYRETHTTFEAYLKERWGISRAQGNRVVLHARVLRSPVGDRIRNERQARELTGLLDHPELLVKVVQRAEEIRGDKRLTAAALRQARVELTLPPDQAAKAREVYEAVEWTEELADEWAEDRLESIRTFNANVPPSEWAWLFGGIQRTPPRSAAEARKLFAQTYLRQAVFDMPLTDEVVTFLRDGFRVTETSPVEMFASVIDGIMKFSPGRSPREGDSEWLTTVLNSFAQVTSEALRAFTMRMQDVVLALGEPPALPERTWTPGEIEKFRVKWKAILADRDGSGRSPLTPGPLLDMTRQTFNELTRFLARIQLEAGRDD